jgi:thiamine biosynthesis lipoprotein ApbE
MKRILFVVASLLILSSGVNASPLLKKKIHTYISRFENVLGTSMEIKVMTTSQPDASSVEKAAIEEINRLSGILSGYNPDSEFSRWLRTSGQPVKISPELFEVLNLFDEWRAKTGGALDASAEVIGKLWKQAASRLSEPTQQELANAVAEVKATHWVLDPFNHSATHLSAAPLMLNSFVKSYIIKQAAATALSSGKTDAVVINIGGDLVVAGNVNETINVSNPKADAENEAPMDQLMVSNKAVATSGNYRRGELINGHWYSHIVDPRTGLPADNIISATVVADNATDAGALATAFNVMKPAESIRLAQTVPGAEYLIITKDGERIASKGWGALETPAIKEPKTNKPKPNASSTDFELLINLEINLQKEGFAKRPYVAVWVEDENHAAVRSIAVWHASDRYINELKSWYLKYRSQYTTDKNFYASVTSATRSAGKYTVKWDGKDDKGEPVKPGKYTLKIEASREHGTYQLMRQEIDWNDTPKAITLPGNIEIAAASLDFRKKTGN